MYSSGVVIVNNSKQLLPAITAVAGKVKDILYVPLAAKNKESASTSLHALSNLSTRELSAYVDEIYLLISKLHPYLDVRVLLPSSSSCPPRLQHNIETVFSTATSYQESTSFTTSIARTTPSNKSFKFEHIRLPHIDSVNTTNKKVEFQTYSDVALGGTFDSVHNGHRLLLTQAALLATNRVLVGVADGPLLASKVLSELIRPVEERVKGVEQLLSDICPGLTREVVPITDVYGPTAWDAELNCLAVTPDTARGGVKVNEERKKKGLNSLAVHTVLLLGEGSDEASTVGEKISSSELRKHQLGSFRKPKVSYCLTEWKSSSGPYVIGLTGGTASGKSSIAKRLEGLGAYCVDCDKLGHEAYRPGAVSYSQVVEEFGEGILNETLEVDRTKLGAIVFSDKAKLERLNEIVWPHILALAEDRMSQAYAQGYKVCVLDAAVLLKAKWDRKCHEVWASIIPAKEAIQRVMERDGKTEEAAKRRMSAQLTNEEVVSNAHVVFCTLWEKEYTQSQVEKAWAGLQNRL